MRWKQKKLAPGDEYTTILAPVITEKATIAVENNQYVFNVRGDATKPEIKEAIECLFDKVKVKAVNTSVVKGKNKRFRGREYTRSNVKKAVVTLEDGQSIDITTGL